MIDIFKDQKIVAVAITKHGAEILKELGGKLPHADLVVAERFAGTLEGMQNQVITYQGPVKANLAALFEKYDQLIFCVSLGAVVRLIGPHLKTKETDPGVLVIDDASRFVVSVLSGHLGGANAFTEKVAGLLGATPVVTTASDANQTIAVDILGRELGWEVEAPKDNQTRVSAFVVNEEPVALIQEAGSKAWWTREKPLPKNIYLFDSLDKVPREQFSGFLWITNRQVPAQIWEKYEGCLVVYHPPKGQV